MVAPTLAQPAPARNGLEVTRNMASGAHLAELTALGVAPVATPVAPTLHPEIK